MDREDYERITSRVTPREEDVIDVADFSAGDRTLVYGYDLARNTVHVYIKDGMLHVYTYQGGSRGPVVEVDYDCGPTLPARTLSPSKRAYPEHTDLEFAERMRTTEWPLCFTTYTDPDPVRAASPYKGKIRSY